MGTTPPGRPVPASVTVAVLATDAVVPTSALETTPGVPDLLSHRAPDPSATVVTPPGAATTAADAWRRRPVAARGRRPRRTVTRATAPLTEGPPMSPSRLRTTVIRAAVCVAVASPLALACAPSASAATNAELAKQVITLVNAQRTKVGCSPLRSSVALGKAAQLHSADMAKYNYFSHTSRDGRSPWQRIRAQGYTYGSAENIAAGQRSATAVVSAWMKSTGHRRNILNCSNKAVGVGVARGGYYGIYWTQDFGTR